MPKQVIYETGGRAREFCELALNHFAGCGHRCVYCYAPRATHVSTDVFQRPRQRVTSREIAAAAARLRSAGEKRPVLLSFTTDPYQPIEAESQLTRQAIQALHAHGLNVVLLTKGGKRACRDFDLLGPGDQFATSLTCLDDMTSRFWEPAAALPMERIESLFEAHTRGIQTWVSLEPIISPHATELLIRQTYSFVGHYKVGKLNYHPGAKQIDWHNAGWWLKGIMDGLGVKYYFKRDLLAKMGARPENFRQTYSA